MDLKPDDEFGKLEELGITSSYVEIKDGVMRPLITAEYALARGFFPRGTKVRWVDQNGYDHQRDIARKLLDPQRTYTVLECEIGSSSSTYQLEEVGGRFNSVMFEKVEE